MDEELPTYQIPAVQDAGCRLLCLMSMGARAFFEEEAEKATLIKDASAHSDHLRRIAELCDWLKEENLWFALSDSERKVMEKAPGQWSKRDQINASWRVEAAGCIAWALQLLVEIPAYDQSFRPGTIMDGIPQTGEATAEWLNGLIYRAEEEIRDARETAELWVWRSRTTQFQKNRDHHAGLPSDEEYQVIIENAAKRGQAEGCFTMFDGDFPAFGKKFADLSEAEWSSAKSIATERMWGLNWLCGYHHEWDEVPLDT
jgi:hypothetical protein